MLLTTIYFTVSLKEIGQNQIGMRDGAKCYQKTGFISNDDNMKNQSILTIGKKIRKPIRGLLFRPKATPHRIKRHTFS